jgi:hypothetical protein
MDSIANGALQYDEQATKSSDEITLCCIQRLVQCCDSVRRSTNTHLNAAGA